MTTKPIVELVPTPDVSRRVEDETPIEIGQWYWVRNGDKKNLCCVTRIGSNYAKVTNVHGTSWRKHFDSWHTECEYEPDPQAYIQRRIRGHQEKVRELFGEIQRVTAQLGIVPRKTIAEDSLGTQTQALAAAHGEADIHAHKQALIEAKKETLPALFKQVEAEHEAMAKWMQAETLPQRAELALMQHAVKRIDERIFTVELYAGLIEQLIKIQDGKPADNDTKLALFQRRHYMDEECLVDYKAGGMSFESIEAFDRWLCKRGNFTRIFPMQRCAVAFRVRRDHKERGDISPWVKIELEKADQTTFLYIRNGEQLWCLRTKIEFGSKLFPDREHESLLNQKDPLWVNVYWSRVEREGIVTRNQYEAKMAEIRAADAKYKRELKEYKAKHKAWSKLSKKEKEVTVPSGPCTRRYVNPEPCSPWEPHHSTRFEEVTPESIYYDDVMQIIADIAAEHNRLAVVLQGLLDRSECLHPHPPWRLWTPEGFGLGVELVYDESRAITNGPVVDFNAYRLQLAKSIKVGSHTIGQERAWLKREGQREAARCDRRGRSNSDREIEFYRPYGDDGPGFIGTVTKISRDGKTCTFEWTRERRGSQRRTWFSKPQSETLNCRIKVPTANLFNVDAYTPGDFRLFYADPRTRAQYLKWAPFLLSAEDWHAGKFKPSGGRYHPIEPEPEGAKPEDDDEDDEKEKIGMITDELEEEDDDLDDDEDEDEDSDDDEDEDSDDDEDEDDEEDEL